VTAAAVNAAARFVMHEDTAVTGVLLPDPTGAAEAATAPAIPVLPGANQPLHLVDPSAETE